jgi:hypothetical protein
LTNITENFVTSLNQEIKKINLDIENLNASKEKITNDKTNLEKELQELKELKRKYVSNVGQVVIDNIIQELQNQYKKSLILNEKLLAMEEFDKWNKNESSNEPELFQYELRLALLSRIYDEEPVKITNIDVFNQQKDFFLQKNNQYGYELINSLSIILLPNSDKIKLENFLNNYSKKTIYQKPTYLILGKWDYNYIKENSAIMQKNITDLENDLPNLKIKLKEFFNNL